MEYRMILLFLFISLSLESTDYYTIYEIDEFFEIIRKTLISDSDANKLIINLKKILERYVYLDILKKPPQPSESYHNTLDLLKELDNVNKVNRPLYDFYRDVKTIIDKCQDLHLNIDLKKKFEDGITLHNSYFISPFILYIVNNEVVSYVNSKFYGKNYFDENIMDIINANKFNPIFSINGEDPINYIQNFNRGFRGTKSPQSTFLLNQNNIPITEIFNYPFEKDNLTDIEIIYSNGNSVTIDFKVLHQNDNNNFLKKFFYLDKTKKNNNNFISFQMLKPKPRINLLESFSETQLKSVKWDLSFDVDILKCRVDSYNKVNVIYQTNFIVSDLNKGYQFLDICFKKFDANTYPIIVIESLNGGGYIDLADYLMSYLNLNKSSNLYGSFRYNNEIKENIANFYTSKNIDTCQIINGEKIFQMGSKEDYYGISENGEKIFHKRTKITNLFTNERENFYNFRKNAKNIRKPTEILIFTDGFSFSATSIFIKKMQSNGGAIIVGYDGNPNLKEFDSSQSPSTYITTSDYYKDSLSKEIENLGFSLSYPVMETFERIDNDNDNETNIPLEYKIDLIDERVYLFNGYYDDYYDNYISEAKKIFEKYQTKCNPKNKNLLLINENCKFSDKHMHGGYECDDKGIWSNKCVASYCDNGYYFDNINIKCIEDVCLKEQNRNNNKNNNYKILAIIFGVLFAIFLIIYIICAFVGGFSRKNYFSLLILISLILFVIFLILFIINK